MEEYPWWVWSARTFPRGGPPTGNSEIFDNALAHYDLDGAVKLVKFHGQQGNESLGLGLDPRKALLKGSLYRFFVAGFLFGVVEGPAFEGERVHGAQRTRRIAIPALPAGIGATP